jgi:hypothetical protein
MAPSPNTAKTQTLNPPKWFDGVDHVGWTEPPRFSRRLFCLSQAAMADPTCWQ